MIEWKEYPEIGGRAIPQHAKRQREIIGRIEGHRVARIDTDSGTMFYRGVHFGQAESIEKAKKILEAHAYIESLKKQAQTPSVRPPLPPAA